MKRIGLERLPYIIVLTAALCPLACREREQAGSEGPQRFLAFVGIGKDDALWQVLRASARRAYGDLGLSSPALRTAAPEISSVNAQKKLLETLRRQGMEALCVQVTEPEALAGALDSLAHQGIRIVTMVRPVAAQVELAHAGYDDEAIGAAVADAIAEAIGYTGTIAVLHADSAGSEFTRRHAAFQARIVAHPNVRAILAFDCKAEPALARRLIADTGKRYPRLSGWAVLGNWPLREHAPGLVPPTCRLVAVDPFPEMWPLLETGAVSAMVASQYDEIARRALAACIAELGGADRMPVPFAAPVRIIRSAGLDTYRKDWSRWTSERDRGDP